MDARDLDRANRLMVRALSTESPEEAKIAQQFLIDHLLKTSKTPYDTMLVEAGMQVLDTILHYYARIAQLRQANEELEEENRRMRIERDAARAVAHAEVSRKHHTELDLQLELQFYRERMENRWLRYCAKMRLEPKKSTKKPFRAVPISDRKNKWHKPEILCPGCNRTQFHHAHGYCHTCYDRSRRRGQVPRDER